MNVLRQIVKVIVDVNDEIQEYKVDQLVKKNTIRIIKWM